MTFDTFLTTINDWGRFQKTKFLIICLVNILPPFIFYTWTFTAATPDFRCHFSLESDDYNRQANELFDMTYKPTEVDCATYQKMISLKECQRCYRRVALRNMTSISNLEKCSNYVFDRSIYTKTLVEEWTMVCDRVLYRTTVQIAYFIGVMTGAIFFGSMADRFGRRPIMGVCCILLTGVSFLSTLGPQSLFGTQYSHMLFVVARFLLACSIRGIIESGFVLSSELVSPKKRVMVGAVMNYFYVFGMLWLVVLAYFIRTWRTLLFTTSLSIVPFSFFYLILPESPRWLVSKGKFNEAEKILKDVAIKNKRQFDQQAYEHFKATQKSSNNSKNTRVGISNLFQSKIAGFITANLFFQWFTQNVVYYGVSQNTGSWQFDPYVSFCASALVEILSYLLIHATLNRMGRKIPYCSLAIAFGVAALLVLPVQTFMTASPSAQRIVLFIINVFLKFCGSATFSIIYLLTTELMPTDTRTTGFGYCSMVGRLGAIMGTFCNDYLTRIAPNFPIILYGIISLVAAGLAILFPETLNRPLPQTAEEVDRMGLAFGILARNISSVNHEEKDGSVTQELTRSVDDDGTDVQMKSIE